MKIKLLSILAALLFTYSAQAACTVTTGCGTFEFPEATSLRVSQSSVNGVTTVIIRDQDGNVLQVLENCPGRVSVSCSSTGGGDVDICDIIPDHLKPIFGCE